MKKTLLHFCFAFCLIQVQAQTSFNKAYHAISESPNPGLINIGTDLYFTSQGNDASNFQNCFIYKYDAAGVLKFRSTILGFNMADKAFASYDNKLIVVG